MKKKIILIMTLAICSASFFGCSLSVNGNEILKVESGGASNGNAETAETGSQSANQTTASVNSEVQTNTTSQTAAVSETKQTSETEAAAKTSTTEAKTEPSSDANTIDGSFTFGDNGVDILSPDEDANDSLLIAAADRLFDVACKIEWKFHVGCPYTLDYNTSISVGDFGWEYYLITDISIKSLSDVENDYYKVFSSSYGNDLSEIYTEKDGKVYALAGERGASIFYKGSKVTGITSRTDKEIFFTVENYYDVDEDDPYLKSVEKDEFSMVIDGKNVRVGKFRLPY